ncbi:MAG: RluA family pseudouridine synthase [Myxococcales bacterium]|nr:RluA family pseudouridine synthase [Myxococcales bacterium]MCB9580668.1 RluA family pseudouridine synthase [Polyangiaceae bacterium]
MAKHAFVDQRLTATEPGALDRVLRDAHPGASWNDVRRLVESGKVRVNDALELDPTRRVDAGANIEIRLASPRPRGSAAKPRIVFADAHVVVVEKPGGISTVPYDERERNTLVDVTRNLLERRESRRAAPLGVVQRLDKETSGLVVFARTLPAKRTLKNQFRAHSVHRRYDALVHGDTTDARYESRLVKDRGDGLSGSTDNPKLGRVAITFVTVVARLDGATHVECRLETGRTHQIRIHLSEAGHPLLGERVYVRGYDAPLIPAPRLMLHARELGFVHPSTGRPMRFTQPPPDDMRALIERLTSSAGSRSPSPRDTSRRRSAPR